MELYTLSQWRAALMNIYRFTGSRCNIRIFNTTQHAPSPLMYVAGHSSPGQNRLRLGPAPPASQPASRSVCVFISTSSEVRYSQMSEGPDLGSLRMKSTHCLQFYVMEKFSFSPLKTCYFSADLVIEVLNCHSQKQIGKLFFFFPKNTGWIFIWRTQKSIFMI